MYKVLAVVILMYVFWAVKTLWKLIKAVPWKKAKFSYGTITKAIVIGGGAMCDVTYEVDGNTLTSQVKQKDKKITKENVEQLVGRGVKIAYLESGKAMMSNDWGELYENVGLRIVGVIPLVLFLLLLLLGPSLESVLIKLMMYHSYRLS